MQKQANGAGGSASYCSETGLAGLVIGVGVVCALHVGKLPPALPVLRDELGVSLVQGGFLLSLVQLGGMFLGAIAGMLADRLGPRRIMLTGLLVLSLACVAGAAAPGVSVLLLTRALEGLGFLLAVLPAPSLLRRMVREPKALSSALGFWGAYMPLGAATALFFGPPLYAFVGWRATWLALALLSLCCLGLVWRLVPPDVADVKPGHSNGMLQRLRTTLSARGPWLVALGFLMYSGQWLAVVGFLPTIYTQAGWSVAAVGVMSALAAGVNMTGNVAVGRLLARGLAPGMLLGVGYLAMALGAVVTFNAHVSPSIQFAAVLVFSAVGGLIPGTLFGLAVRLAPSGQTVSTTVGWVQQLSSLGQFAGPPAVAWLAAKAGGWQHTWWITGSCCAVGLLLALLLQRQVRHQHSV